MAETVKAPHHRADPFACDMNAQGWSLDAIDLAVERRAILVDAGHDEDMARVLAAMEVARQLPEARLFHHPPAAPAPETAA